MVENLNRSRSLRRQRQHVSGSQPRRAKSGIIIVELVVALGMLTAALLPLAYSFVREQRLARAYYYRAVASEIVDGETEILAAGEWKSFGVGVHPYSVNAGALKNLPPGQFLLTIDEKKGRLEWRPRKAGQGGKVVREWVINAGKNRSGGEL